MLFRSANYENMQRSQAELGIQIKEAQLKFDEAMAKAQESYEAGDVKGALDALKDANTYAAQKQTAAAATYGHQLQAATQLNTNETIRKAAQEDKNKDEYFKRKTAIDMRRDKELSDSGMTLNEPAIKSPSHAKWKSIMDAYNADVSALNTAFKMEPATPSGGGAININAIDAVLRARSGK